MKLLQNRLVTSLLVLAAIGIVVYQFRPMFSRYFRSRPSAPAPAAKAPEPAPAKAAAAPASAHVQAVSVAAVRQGYFGDPNAKAVDYTYIREHLAQWIDSPARDPFLLLSDAPEAIIPVPEGPSPVEKWELKAIWRQTGRRYAAVNQGIYKEGDMIEGYKLERIEDDQVVFRGTNHIERLTFRNRPAPGSLPPIRVNSTNQGVFEGRTNLYYRP